MFLCSMLNDFITILGVKNRKKKFPTLRNLTHCGRVTQICVFNTVKLVHLQVLLSATPQGGMFPEVSQPQALLGSLMIIS